MTAVHEPTGKGGVPHRGLTQAKVRAMCFSKSPQTPLYKRGALNGISLMQTSHLPPFAKEARHELAECGDQGGFYCSIFTLRAKLNYTTSIAGGVCKY